MAEFNPDVHDPQAPDFIRFPRPSYERLIPNESAKVQGESTAKAIVLGAHGLDEAFKLGIDSQVRDTVEKQRDVFASSILNDKSQDTSETLLPKDTETAPPALKVGLDNTDKLQKSMETRGIPEMYYWGNLNSAAQSLRAKFPGYRDYIDEQFRQKTGHDPANQLMRASIEAMHRAQTQKDNIRNAIAHEGIRLSGEGLLNPQDLSNFIDGKTDQDTFLKKIYSINAGKAASDREVHDAEVKAKLRGAGVEEQVFANTPLIQNKIRDFYAQNHDSIVTGGGAHSLDDITQIAHDVTTGKKDIPSTTWVAWAGQMDAAQARMESVAMNWAVSKGMVEKFGGDEDKVKKVIHDTFENEYFKPVRDLITKQDFGMFAFHAKQIKGMETDDQLQAMNDPVIGQAIRKSMVFSKSLPPTVFATVQADQMLTPENISHLSGTFKLNNYLAQRNPDGSVFTPAQGLDLIQKNSKNPNSDTYIDYLKGVNMIKTPGMPADAIVRSAESYFSPHNMNMLEKLPDEKDKRTAFNLFTSTDISSAIKKAGDAQTNENYRNWSEQSFATQIFTRDIADLRDELEKMNQPGNREAKKVQFGWDDQHGQLVVDAVKQPTVLAQQQARRDLARAQTLVTRLNTGLWNMKGVEEATGGNLDAFFIGLLTRQGTDPAFLNLSKQIIQAIALTKQKPEKPEKTE